MSNFTKNVHIKNMKLKQVKSMIDVCLLGCGGSMPTKERFLSATLINYQGRKILIDCGEGCQVSMKMLGWGFKTIDVICLTHFHGDHLYGLPGLLSTIGNSGRTDSITLIGPIGLKDLFSDLKILLPYLPYELIFYENPLIFSYQDIEIKTLQLDHSSPCLGYSFYLKRKPKFDVNKAQNNKVPKALWSQLQNGKNIFYQGKEYLPDMVLGSERIGIKISIITDTRPIKTIPDFISKSDLFICEGTYGDNSDINKAINNKHMTFCEAASLAKEGMVEELILTHFSPILSEPEVYLNNAKKEFKNTVTGYDRLLKTLRFK